SALAFAVTLLVVGVPPTTSMRPSSRTALPAPQIVYGRFCAALQVPLPAGSAGVVAGDGDADVAAEALTAGDGTAPDCTGPREPEGVAAPPLEAPGPIGAPATTSLGREPSSQIQAAGAEATTRHRAMTSIARRAPKRRRTGRLGRPGGEVIVLVGRRRSTPR